MCSLRVSSKIGEEKILCEIDKEYQKNWNEEVFNIWLPLILYVMVLDNVSNSIEPLDVSIVLKKGFEKKEKNCFGKFVTTKHVWQKSV